jgi:hypothetical protein
MLLPLHHAHDVRKLSEFIALCRSQLVFFEERDDSVEQMPQSVNGIDHEVFSVIVMPPIAIDVSAAESVTDQLQDTSAAFTLHNRESWLQLPSPLHRVVSVNGATEATFSVYEADDPTRDS